MLNSRLSLSVSDHLSDPHVQRARATLETRMYTIHSRFRLSDKLCLRRSVLTRHYTCIIVLQACNRYTEMKPCLSLPRNSKENPRRKSTLIVSARYCARILQCDCVLRSIRAQFSVRKELGETPDPEILAEGHPIKVLICQYQYPLSHHPRLIKVSHRARY